ncbi:MAG: hypothetical protein ACM3NQ_18950 [Bacteroidales bacterium]
MLWLRAVVFFVVLAGLEAAAFAQMAPARADADVEDRAARLEDPPGLAVPGSTGTPRLASGLLSTRLRQLGDGENVPRSIAVFAPPPTLLAGTRFPRPRNPAARTIRSIHGRFLPIPLQWRTRAPLDSRSMMAVTPSLIVGRRPTMLPEGVRDAVRGGRTFGFGIQMRISVGQSPPGLKPPAAPPRTAPIASRVKALLPFAR